MKKLASVVNLFGGVSLTQLHVAAKEGFSKISLGLLTPGFLSQNKYICKEDLVPIVQSTFYVTDRFHAESVFSLVKDSILLSSIKYKSEGSKIAMAYVAEDLGSTHLPMHTIFVLQPKEDAVKFMPYLFALLSETNFLQKHYPFYSKVGYFTQTTFETLEIPDLSTRELATITTLANGLKAGYVAAKEIRQEISKLLNHYL